MAELPDWPPADTGIIVGVGIGVGSSAWKKGVSLRPTYRPVALSDFSTPTPYIFLLVWSAHQLKVRRVVSRLQLIAAERVRFGRELHDSLLQGFSGLVFLLEAAARQFETAPDVAKQRLERAIDQADRSLREAREMIVSMRIQCAFSLPPQVARLLRSESTDFSGTTLRKEPCRVHLRSAHESVPHRSARQ